MINVQEVNHIQELADIRADWRSLLLKTPGAGFFQTFEWLEVWWKFHHQGKKLRALLIFADGDLVGLVPFIIYDQPTRVGKLRFLSFPQAGWGSFFGPIGPITDDQYSAAFEHIRKTKRDWDVIEPRWVDTDGVDRGLTAKAMSKCGLKAYAFVQDRTSIVTFNQTWDEYRQGKTSKNRNNFKRAEKRLHNAGRVEYVRYRPAPGEADGDNCRMDLYDAALTVAGRSWQAHSADGTTLTHDSVAPFLRAAYKTAARNGNLDLNLLYLDGTPIAFALNFIYKGSLQGIRIGYDQGKAPSGTGNTLHLLMIENSFQLGDRVYDMGPGSVDIKKVLRTEIRNIYRYSHVYLLAVRPFLYGLKRLIDIRKLDKSETSTSD